MKIRFEQYEQQTINGNPAPIDALEIAGSGERGRAEKNQFLVDLKSSDNSAAYGFKGIKKDSKKSIAEMVENAENYDAETASRFMAVMSNTMSEKDFNKMMEEGYDPASMEIAEAVTNLDRIKVTLAESGTVITGFNDNIDRNTAAEITGSISAGNKVADAEVTDSAVNMLPKITDEEIDREIENALEEADLPLANENIESVREAFDKAKGIKELSDNGRLYMVNNGLEPTIENVYEAEYSSGSGQYRYAKGYFSVDGSAYMASKAENIDFNSIAGQIDEVIEAAGFQTDESLRNDAKWLVENGVALTKESFTLFEDLKLMEIPPDDNLILGEITDALRQGKDATEAYLISGYRKIKNSRILEEIRLQMTHKANAAMAESDFSLDTEELSDKVDLLKEKENIYYRLAFGGRSSESGDVEDDIDLFNETLRKVGEIKGMPVDLMARFSSAEEFTLNDVYDVGNSLKQRYENTMKNYEAVGTEVRTDLGDNIQDAFKNVDEILKSLGFEASYDNQRAVRILGYNNIAITANNIENVRYVDSQVRSLIDKMNPATTVRLIQMRIDPMEIDVGTLSDIVDTFSEEDDTNANNYAKFLLNLEHNNEISDEEATSYIGIYRLFDKIVKSDGAIIGSLISSGKDLTLKNLLTESRNQKKYGKIDELIDDEHIKTEAQENSENLKIDTQIDTAFRDDYLRHSTKEILRRMTPDALKHSDINEESSLNDILKSIEEYSEKNEEAAKAEYELTANELREAAKADVEIFNILRQLDVKVSAENINAAAEIFRNRGSIFSKLFDEADDEEKEDIEENAEDLAESFDDEESAKKAYADFMKKSADILREKEMQKDKSIDLKALQLVGKELSVAKSLSDHEDYEMPVFIDGKLTSVNLRIVHGDGEGRVDVRIETESLGNVSASFTVRDGNVDGTIISDKMAASLKWRNGTEEFGESLKNNGLSLKNLNIVTEMNVRNTRILKENGPTAGRELQKTDSAALYKTAKCFIAVIRKI